MSDPLVSVVVSVYNAKPYVKRCIDSILEQTLRGFEIILVDDASTDGSFELCRELYGSNDKIKFVRHEKNLGIGVTRNTGINQASGKYICFVNGEDFILPSALKKFYTAAEKTSADIVHAAGWFELSMDESAPNGKENSQLKWDKYSQDGLLKNHLLYRLEEHWKKGATSLHAWLCFCRREFLAAKFVTFLDIIAADEIFIFALMCLTERYYILRASFYIKRNLNNPPVPASKNFSDGVRAMLVGSAYMEKFLDHVPTFKDYTLWRENLLAAFFYRVMKEHTAPHYENLLTNAEWDALTDEIMSATFPNGRSFAKYFFNGFHAFRQKSAIFSQRNHELLAQTANLFKRMEISRRKIVFVNAQGGGYACNPKYIAEEILRQNLRCDLVWLVRDVNSPIPQKIRKVAYNGIDSAYELATAKIIVTNTRDELPFQTKKRGQFLIVALRGEQTFTRLKQDSGGAQIDSAAIDLMLANTPEQFDEFRNAFNYGGEILRCGLPRNDILFRNDTELIAQIKRNLNVPPANKVVMYSPIARADFSADVYRFDANKLLDVLRKKFGGNWTLLLHLPANVPAEIFGSSDKIINATTYPDVQELILISDVLISDYSPVICDCIFCRKTVFIFAQDFDAYTAAHDFKPLFAELPCAVNKSEPELFACIETFDTAAHIPKTEIFVGKVNPFDTGYAAAEVVARIKSVISGA